MGSIEGVSLPLSFNTVPVDEGVCEGVLAAARLLLPKGDKVKRRGL